MTRPFILFVLVFFAGRLAMAEVSVKEEVPFRADSGLTKAEYFLATGKYAEALGETAAVIQRHGPNADAYTYLGYAYAQLGDSKQARANFTRALALMPTHLGANAYLALHYLDKNNMAKALEQMQVLRAVCGASGCEELLLVESAINAAKKGTRAPTAGPTKASPKRGETPREVE